MRMRRIFTPKLKQLLEQKMSPKKTTVDFIMAFAATYEVPKTKDKKIQLPGMVLN